jgi:hypothetical protein
METTKHSKPISVSTDKVFPVYKVTAVKAAEDMPAEGSLNSQSKFVYDKLRAAHPEIAWVVELIRYTPAKLTETVVLWRSLDPS